MWIAGGYAQPRPAPPQARQTKVAILSTESIASEQSAPGAATRCAACGSPLAPNQRYCLECGERRAAASSVLAGGAPLAGAPRAAGPAPAAPPPELLAPPREPAWQRNGALTLLAGVGVLLLAMGVGVLIGRAGNSGKAPAAAPQVITVASGGASTNAAGSSESTFTGDWPAGKKGYTVQLQTLPGSSAVSAVEAAKSAATAKGAKSVGALKSDEYSSLPAGSYVVYSGVYGKRSEAQRALAGLQKSFPSAKVVEVSNGGSSTAAKSSSEPEVKQPGGTGESINKPAPPSVLEGLKKAKGKSYVEKAKNLPNVVGT